LQIGDKENMSADKRPEHHKRDLLLSDRISQGTVKDIIKDIFEINFDDDEKEEIYKDWERKPIQLFINSYGGSVYDGLALIDVIKRSKTPVHTVCIGSCMSMALWVWLSGAKRFVGESATLMFHDVSLFAYDKTEGIKQELNEMIRLQEMLASEIVEKSMIKEETLRDYISRKAEWYIPATEAITLKLADKYYK
jgi:ATP-dependent Clp protease protease subunit